MRSTPYFSSTTCAVSYLVHNSVTAFNLALSDNFTNVFPERQEYVKSGTLSIHYYLIYNSLNKLTVGCICIILSISGRFRSGKVNNSIYLKSRDIFCIIVKKSSTILTK